MTVLLYSYRHNDNDGEELRYSLRSMQQNLLMDDRDLQVMIVGDRLPSWCMPDEFVLGTIADSDERKGDAIAASVRTAVGKLDDLRADVHFGPVLYLDDDYFLLDKTDSVLDTDAGPLYNHMQKCKRDLRRGHWYTEAMIRTYSALFGVGHGVATSYELHRPMKLDLESAVLALDTIPQGVFWRTWYGNVADLDSHTVRDGRYVGRSLPLGIPWVSTEDQAWADWAGKRIMALFPQPSRWER